ncbi:glycosyltransferase family 2 protein [Candidatus Woesebacteria bacterium]|nr:glycosyltransferase family 2 protein [Candidatus Woesebacteria bacterium]
MVTVVISTANEEKNIKDCVQSAHLLSEHVLVFDMQSTDNTVRIAEKAGARVVVVEPSGYVEPIRTRAILESKDEWVCILDADERMTPELAAEIKSIVNNPSRPALSPTHYRIPRKNIFGSTWLQHGGWYPDKQIRLINKFAFRDWPARIHSAPSVDGEAGVLVNPITHFFHSNLTHMVAKTIKYEMIESELLFEANRPVQTLTLFRKFFGELLRRLVKFQGFRDGMMGWIESIYQAYSKTITYIFLYEKYIQ